MKSYLNKVNFDISKLLLNCLSFFSTDRRENTYDE